MHEGIRLAFISVFAFLHIGVFAVLDRRFERREFEKLATERTPAFLWAKNNHWKYRANGTAVSQEILEAAFPNVESVDTVAESIQGIWQGYQAWAFTISGHSGRYEQDGEAVVVALDSPWNGILQITRNPRFLDEPMQAPSKISAAKWHVGGDGNTANKTVLTDSTFSNALIRTPLPKDVFLSVEGDYAVIDACWHENTKLLEHCLDLLVALANACKKAMKG